MWMQGRQENKNDYEHSRMKWISKEYGNAMQKNRMPGSDPPFKGIKIRTIKNNGQILMLGGKGERCI